MSEQRAANGLDHVLRRARELAAAGDDEGAVRLLSAAVADQEEPEGRICVLLARSHQRLGAVEESSRWLVRAIDATEDFTTWQASARLARRLGGLPSVPVRRRERLALLGSYTTDQLGDLVWLAAARQGLDLDMHHGMYGQYRQEVLDPGSALYGFDPGVVVFATHEGDVELPPLAADPVAAVEDELPRWTTLWERVQEKAGAHVVQHAFAVPPESPLGHLGMRLEGSRSSTLAALNRALGSAAGPGVGLVDCDRLAGAVGKRAWFDPRFWQLSRQAVGLTCLPLLAKHTVGVVLGLLGLSRKCIVLDLDNTLWGGVVGEEGIDGIALGPDRPGGEAFTLFQEHLLELKRRGIVLAVVSKNDEHVASEPFRSHPGMALGTDDIALFVASWDPKPDLIRRVAETLDLGLDAVLFVDDNPVEREAVRRALPAVDVLVLPEEPARYTRALADYPNLEIASLTRDDAHRTEQYRGRALSRAAQEGASSLDEFLAELQMVGDVRPFEEPDIPRIAQLVNKTNQFNLTTRRRTASQLEGIAGDDRFLALTGRLRDRFTDHGLVAVLIATGDPGTPELEIDTWLMSCRVLGRTFEHHVLDALVVRAVARGHRVVIGRYVPSDRNAVVRDLYPRLGFQQRGDGTWALELDGSATVPTSHVQAVGEE